MDPDTEGPLLPRSGTEEYRPYVGRLPEFKFWCVAPGGHGGALSPRRPGPAPPPCRPPRRYAGVKAILTAGVLTLVPLFDVPVFWPILLVYFLTLFALTMRNQIAHMIKFRYVPFAWGKAKYGGKGKRAGDKGAEDGARFNPASVR